MDWRDTRVRLGPLERAVMDCLWRAASVQDVAMVHRDVGAPRGVTRSTIHSTLERLVRKGLVARSRRGRAYEYRSTGSRTRWVSDFLDSALADLEPMARDALLVGFVDFAERTSDATLRELEALVQARLAARARGERKRDPDRGGNE